MRPCSSACGLTTITSKFTTGHKPGKGWEAHNCQCFVAVKMATALYYSTITSKLTTGYGAWPGLGGPQWSVSLCRVDGYRCVLSTIAALRNTKSQSQHSNFLFDTIFEIWLSADDKIFEIDSFLNRTCGITRVYAVLGNHHSALGLGEPDDECLVVLFRKRFPEPTFVVRGFFWA